MSRATMRRSQREQQKAKTATYNLTSAQLDSLIEEKLKDRLSVIKRAGYVRCG